jgi:hypothetical protein
LVAAAAARGQEAPQAQEGAQRVEPQEVQKPLAARAAAPANPQFYVNRKQADLRDHHLVKTPEVRRAPQAALAAPVDKGPQTDLAPQAAAQIQLQVNHGLTDAETSGLTSTVGEPSAAASRDGRVLMTGNWYAAFSTNNGQSFQFVSPEQTFPNSPHVFCCDQAAIYSPEHDVMIWFLQYLQDGHSNTIRVAVARGDDDIRNQRWRYYDFSPQSVGSWQDEWFDFPDIAITRDFLYISINSFSTAGTEASEDDSFARAVALRLPLAELAGYQPVSSFFFQSEEAFSLRPTHGAQGAMHFGTHDFSSFGNRIQVFSWNESNNTIQLRNVDVAPWSNAERFSECPDGNRWLNRCDFRMTGAWASGAQAGFAWTAAQDDNFPEPHVRVAVVDLNTGNRVAEPHIWNPNFAFAYPYLATNAQGTVGISLSYGGGGLDGLFVSHGVGILESQGSGLQWNLAGVKTGTAGPTDRRWGDYLAVRPHGGNQNSWIATGMTLEGGSLAQNIVPRYVQFTATTPHAPEEGKPRDQTANIPGDQKANIRNELQQIRQRIDVLIGQLNGDSPPPAEQEQIAQEPEGGQKSTAEEQRDRPAPQPLRERRDER